MSSRVPAAVTLRSFLADRRLHWTAAGLAGAALLVLLTLGFFPWGAFKGTVEKQLSDKFGSKVTIGSMTRDETFSFTPTVSIRDLTVPQPDWAGKGDLARIGRAQISFAALPLLIGRFRLKSVHVDGARLSLVRDVNGRKNYKRDNKQGGGDGSSPSLTGLTLTNSSILYRDAKQQRYVLVNVAADAQGVRLAGHGTIRGAAVQLAARGAAVDGWRGGGWPFHARITGAALNVDAVGNMDAPLDTGHMVLDVKSRADDLKLLDAVIEAGLFGTQPLALNAHVRHDGREWVVTGLNGTIGRSRIAGRVTVTKPGDRTHIEGDLRAAQLDFDDLSSDEGRAIAAAKRAVTGPRVLPETRIDIHKIARTDGRIVIRIDRFLSKTPSPFVSADGVLNMDHRLLTLSPLTIRLTRGTLAGKVTVDQHDGAPMPLLTLDLALANSRIAAFAGAGVIDAPLKGWMKVTGRGETIREAVGRSTGTVALAALDGTIPANAASFLGLDVGRGLLVGKDQSAQLRCMLIRLDVRGGMGRPNPILIDTNRSQANAQGSVNLADESLNLKLYGAPKQSSLLRLRSPVTVTGTIKEPKPQLPPGSKSLGNILGMFGRALIGDQQPLAQDANCGAEAARVLRK